MPSDEQLVQRARDHDEAAIAELIRRHQRAVYRLALRMLADPDDADDATQETFVRAYRYLASFEANRSFANWLFGIAIRQCATIARRRQRRNETSLEEAPEATTPWPHRDAAKRAALRAAILRLPGKQRLAFVLFAHEEHSLAEIAEALNCSVGSVKTHLHRARQRLRRELQHLVGQAASLSPAGKGGESHELPASAARAERPARRPCPSTS